MPDDGELMTIAQQQIDWIAEKHAISHDTGALALLAVLMGIRDAAARPSPQVDAPAPAAPRLSVEDIDQIVEGAGSDRRRGAGLPTEAEIGTSEGATEKAPQVGEGKVTC